MNKKILKLMVAGAFVACAVGGFAVGLAWATPGQGITTTIISGPTQLGEVHVKSESDVNKVKIKTEGLSDIYVVYNKIVPGGPAGRAGPTERARQDSSGFAVLLEKHPCWCHSLLQVAPGELQWKPSVTREPSPAWKGSLWKT